MSSSILTCLSIAVRSVRESMVHDSQDRKKEAFCQYLSNVMYICEVVKNEVWQKDLKGCYSQETLKLFKLSNQCLERAEDLLKFDENTDVSSTIAAFPSTQAEPVTPLRKTSQDSTDHSSSPIPNQNQPTSNISVPTKHSISSPPISPSFHRRKKQVRRSCLSVLSELKEKHKRHLNLLSKTDQAMRNNANIVQYVDDAKRGNIQLLTAYRARMERREKQIGSNTRLARKTDVTTMNLSLFRKMAENIELAKARQQSLQRKTFERQQRLRQEADRRMGPSSLLSCDEQLKKELYVKILEFEQEAMWLVSLRDQLNARPDDSSLIQHIINEVLGTNEHPITKYLKSYQLAIHQQLTTTCKQAQDILVHITNMENMKLSDVNQETEPSSSTAVLRQDDEEKQGESDDELCELLDYDAEVRRETGDDSCAERSRDDSYEVFLSEEKETEYKNVLETIVKKVQYSLEMLHSLFLLVYEPLSSAAGQDLCFASVECTFFKHLWPLLLNLYRLVNYRREIKLVKVFRTNASCTPKHLNVPDRLCLNNEDSETNETTDIPYQPVVDELTSLKTFSCPLEKLECIVRTNRFIVECVEEYYETKGMSRNSPETVIGCDDLLPILSYVIVRSNLPQLVSECHAMEDFISSDYLMGEEGYSLTTFQTALAYLETLDDNDQR